MVINKNPVEGYKSVLEMQRNDGDSFQSIVEVLDETKVNMIHFLFNVISDSDLDLVCIKYFKDERVVSERSHLWLHKGFGWKNCKLLMHESVSMEYNKG